MANLAVIELTCPSCNRLLKIRPEMAGQQLNCPKADCGASIRVPGTPEKPSDIKFQIMMFVGIVFTLIAAVLAIKEIKLAYGWIISFGLVATVFVSEFFRGYAKTIAIAVFTIVGLSTPTLYFMLERKPDQKEITFFVGTAIFFALSIYLVARNYRTWANFSWNNSDKKGDYLSSIIIWLSVIVSSIAFLWVAYYKFLTSLGQAEHLWRRLVFTLFFVVFGVVASAIGRNRLKPFLGIVGLVYMAAGVIKALAYDISHTDGVIRIGVFAGSGVVLLIGGFFMMKKSTKPAAINNATAFIED